MMTGGRGSRAAAVSCSSSSSHCCTVAGSVRGRHCSSAISRVTIRARRTLAGQPWMGAERSVRAICSRTALGTGWHRRSRRSSRLNRAYRGLRSRISSSAERVVSVDVSGRVAQTFPARNATYTSWAAVAGLALTGVLRAGGDVSGAQDGPGSRPVGSVPVVTAAVVVTAVVVVVVALSRA